MAKNAPAADIEEISAALQFVGVTASVFDPDTYLQLHYTEAELASLLRPFLNLDHDVCRLRILRIGILHSYFDTIHGASAAQFYAFVEFLNTPAGQDALALTSRQDRLARERFSAQEMDLIAVCEVQQDALTTHQSDSRRRHEATLDELERRLREVRSQFEVSLTQIRERFSPIGLYTPLSNSQLESSCWNEYILECGRQNLLPVEQSDASVRKIVKKFGDKIKQRHVLDFIDEGDHKQQLLDYINRKIADLDDQGTVRYLRRLVALVCPQPTAPPPSDYNH